MTTTTDTTDVAHRKSAQTGLRVTQLRVIASEWTKFFTLRSTLWTLLISVLLTVGVGALFSLIIPGQYGTVGEADVGFDATATSLDGVLFAQLAIGILGVLLVAAEYSTGMIRSTLTVIPRRLPMLWAKLTVLAGVTFVITLASGLVAFFLGQSLMGSDLGVGLSTPGTVGKILGAALYVTLAGMIGMALGSLLRSTAAGISTYVGVFFVLPAISQALPASFSSHFVQYLPTNAGAAMFGSAGTITNALPPLGGFTVLLGYVVVLVGAAAWRLKTIDA